MIINVTGTSGAGKSFLVRRFLNWVREHGRVKAVYAEGSKRSDPIGYRLTWGDPKRFVYVIGAYEAPTGGCDTVKDIEVIYGTIEREHAAGWDVLYEGLFVMNQTRGPQLAERWPGEITVMRLDTPLTDCYAAIDARRASRGKDSLDSRHNTRYNYKRARNYSGRMSEAGARIVPVTRDTAYEVLMGLLTAGRPG